MSGPPAARTRDLRRIHLGARMLGLGEDAYRDLLEAETGQRSAGQLDAAGRRRVLDRMWRDGVRFEAPDPRRCAPRPQPRRDIVYLLKKIDALCINHPGGRKPRRYAEGILRQMTGADHRVPLEWAANDQLGAVIAALQIDVRRRAAEEDPDAA